MGVTATDFQNLIINSLAEADPTVRAGLQTYVPKYWQLWNRNGVLPELQYWYVRRESIRFVMANVRRQTDYALLARSASRNMTANSRNDSTMNASASENASSVANRSASSSYSDATNSSGSGSSISNRSASQTMNASSSMSDTGSGANSASQSSTLSSSATVNASSCDSMASDRQGVDDVTAYREHILRSDKRSAGGAAIGAGAAMTFSATFEEMPINTNYSTVIRSSDGQSQYLARMNDTRANSLSQSSTQSSSSHFNANRTTNESMASSGSSLSTSSSTNTFSLTGSGSGSMTGSGSGGSSMVASSTRSASATGEAHRVSVAESASNSTAEKLHQRFLQLQDLWEKANEMIHWYEKQRLNLPAYVFEQMTLQYPSGLNADAANAYLIKTPYGTKGLIPL